MLTVTADASWPSSPGEVWAALGRRESYLCFPGLSPAPRPSDSAVSGLSPAPRTINRVVSGLPPARRTRAAETSRPRGAVLHELDLPIVDRREQIATLTVGRAGARRPHGANTRGGDARGRNRRGAARRFSVRGPLVSIAGCWQLEPAEGGVRARLTLRYDIAEPLRTEAVNTLRSRSPLPIRTDADAILEALAVNGAKPSHVEGYDRSEWVLLDYFDFIVHIFAPETRAFYGLERLWGSAERIELSPSR